jgi:hypothetical protein
MSNEQQCASRWGKDQSLKTAPNKSLDRSGGGVFSSSQSTPRLCNRAARSTEPLDCFQVGRICIMKARTRIAQILLWLAVIGLSIWVGGTLYQMLVIVPIWNATPPESVRAFFLGTRYNQTIWNFFGPPWMVARMVPLLGALLFGWHLSQHRKWLVVAVICMGFGVLFTLFYIYRINDVLFLQAGGDRSPEEIRAMARHWILADRVRFVVGCVSFLALLRALSVPFVRD